MTIVSIFRGGGFGNLARWYSYFFGTIIRHTRVELVHSFSVSLVIFYTVNKNSRQYRPTTMNTLINNPGGIKDQGGKMSEI